MTILTNYHAFEGVHYETGTIHNILAYQGVVAPHTGQPLSEALLLGISGGITVGYFIFEYTGLLPHLALLTRNTFHPLPMLLERLAIPHDVRQTSKPEIAEATLIAALESGCAPYVLADMFSLPYNLLPHDPANWAMLPLVVFGLDNESAYLADRSRQPLNVPRDQFAAARARVKADRYRLVTLEAPDFAKLPGAVTKAIWACISLYTDRPPRGKKENFGLAALDYLAEMLINTRNKQSWERYFPAGPRLGSALAGGLFQPGFFDWIEAWGTADGADRGTYADFLDEAAVILSKPALGEAAESFRTAYGVWRALAASALPDSVPEFKAIRELKVRKHQLFREQGADALDQIGELNTRLKALIDGFREQFPLSDADAADLRGHLRDHLRQIRDIEGRAVATMQAALTHGA